MRTKIAQPKVILTFIKQNSSDLFLFEQEEYILVNILFLLSFDLNRETPSAPADSCGDL